MPPQDTVSIVADAAPELHVDRQLLIDGRLVTYVDQASEIAQDEIFGPDAVRIANNSIYGLR
jgi:acyl-CoA reductase-like NAD-dependent aldehyde dehydrogenase